MGKNDLFFFRCKTGDAQIEIPANKPYGLTINMGSDDVSVAAIVYRKNQVFLNLTFYSGLTNFKMLIPCFDSLCFSASREIPRRSAALI